MDKEKFKPIIDILAFLGSQKYYSYIDRLGNALDEISILEAINDAIRDFYSMCGSKQTECPQIDSGKLQDAVKELTDMIQDSEKSTRFQVLQFARELSLNSYAHIKNFVPSKKEEGTEQLTGA